MNKNITVQSLITLFKKLEKHTFNISNVNLNHIQRYILKYIVLGSDNREIYQKDIEQQFGLSKSTVSEILKSFEKDDLVIRIASEKDQRLKIIKMTDKSRIVRQEILDNIQSVEDLLVENLSNQEITNFNETLLKMIDNLQKGEKQ
ncbi:MarR family winged helix-turn-helix transcriptional regulator [Streptobacillus canis]|uniref:MarR family winged helix-turn-helix transcriptional regulator n=1 Tax=Streptobacillus canis TaxID=2678686 RepID=UPI0012E2B01C|nr:MarR family winged helix-turn-helix transcriptional regulator [Streptobacillus canis]